MSYRIGVIDSGIGGLSFVRKLITDFPGLDIRYIADSLYLPYGSRTVTEIQDRVVGIAESLLEEEVAAIVIACNTATAAAVDTLREKIDIPIIGFEPPVKPAVLSTKSGVVGVWVTPTTAASDRFLRLVNTYQGLARILVQPCEDLAEAIEEGSEEVPSLVKRYLQPFKDAGVDSLALGCTHYELISDLIQSECSMTLFEPSTGAIRRLRSLLGDRYASSSAISSIRTTGPILPFKEAAIRWLPDGISESSFAVF